MRHDEYGHAALGRSLCPSGLCVWPVDRVGRERPPGLVSERIIGRLAGEADFTEDQRERLEALFAEREGRFRQFNREMRERFEAEQASLRDGVATILTPTQMEIFDAARRPGRRRQRPGPIRDPGLNRIE